MQFNMWFLLCLVAFVLLLVIGRRLQARSNGSERKWLPKELRDAELVYAEKLFRSGGAVPIVAKCDRAYRTKKGVIVLVELKTRRLNRTYLSDVIELSATRFAIQMQTDVIAAGYGYVLVQRSGKQRRFLHRVELLSDTEVVALANRRVAILNGNIVPQYACSDRLCTKCNFIQKCNLPANTRL